MSSPQPDERLYMYLVVSNWVINVVLFGCILDKEQRLVYYISKAMADMETICSKMEQTAYQLVPQKYLHKPDLSGRMLKWAIELSEYGIEYQPRLSIKRQVMANFIVEIP